MSKIIRNVPGYQVQDPSAIAAMEFSKAAGSKKVSEVGRHLLAIPYITGGSVAYTTNTTAATALPSPGLCLAVYNNANAVGSITLGTDNTVSSLAPGVTDSTGKVGIPCAPNTWTYIACDSKNWVISSASTLLVFIIDDETSVKTEVK